MDFAFFWEIRNPDFKIRNPDFKIRKRISQSNAPKETMFIILWPSSQSDKQMVSSSLQSNKVLGKGKQQAASVNLAEFTASRSKNFFSRSYKAVHRKPFQINSLAVQPMSFRQLCLLLNGCWDDFKFNTIIRIKKILSLHSLQSAF